VKFKNKIETPCITGVSFIKDLSFIELTVLPHTCGLAQICYKVKRVRAQVKSRWICGGQSGSGADFLQALLLSLPIIPPIAEHSSTSIIILG
jgi:hypothetical protein